MYSSTRLMWYFATRTTGIAYSCNEINKYGQMEK